MNEEYQNNEMNAIPDLPAGNAPAGNGAGKGGDKTAKYVCIALAGVVVVLLIVVAFLLGQRSGKKPTDDPSVSVTGGGVSVTDVSGGTTAAQITDPTFNGNSSTAADLPIAEAPANLTVSMTAGSLTFVSGTDFNVAYDPSVINVTQSGDSVTVENAHSNPTASERNRMNVTVTVPENYIFRNVDIEFGAGKLIVRSLGADTLSLQLGAGSSTLDNLTVTGSADIQQGAGALDIKSGNIANLTLQCGAGATQVKAALPGSSRINAAVGAVNIDLSGSAADYTVTFNMSLGACYYNSEKIARSGSYGSGPNTVDISGGFGVMRVNVR